jgi:hypothetical protein
MKSQMSNSGCEDETLDMATLFGQAIEAVGLRQLFSVHVTEMNRHERVLSHLSLLSK